MSLRVVVRPAKAIRLRDEQIARESAWWREQASVLASGDLAKFWERYAVYLDEAVYGVRRAWGDKKFAEIVTDLLGTAVKEEIIASLDFSVSLKNPKE